MITMVEAITAIIIISSAALIQSVGRLANSALMGNNQAYRVEEMISIMTQPDDDLSVAELVRRCAGGDEKAIEAIYHRFKTPIFNLARRYTRNSTSAEDILQEVFVIAITHIGDVKDVAKFPGWLFRVAINTSLAYVKSGMVQEQAQVPIEDVERTLASTAGEDSGAAMRRPLEQAIDVLPPRLKTVFLLHDVEGFKHEEIAGMLGCTAGTSKSNLFKARMKLRQYLMDRGYITKIRTQTQPGPGGMEAER
jgi:RNA polymerase sigma-70 factor (ECF subfamily)